MAKQEHYEQLIKQLPYLLEETNNVISNLANFTALLYQMFPTFSWVGFYLFQNGELQLGPFQGKVACTKIQIGQGVCGTAAQIKKPIIVPNVHDFEGHITCDEYSLSEIVIPIIKNDSLLGVLDIDSYKLNNFDDQDAYYLKTLVQILINYL